MARKTCHAHALCSTEPLDSGAIFVELIMDALPDSGSVPVVTIAAKACLCNRSVEASSVRASIADAFLEAIVFVTEA